MKAKVRTDFRELVMTHQNIIKAITAQKVRTDSMIEKYGDMVQEEANLPVNRYLAWSKVISPYLDQVVSGKVSDFQLIKSYKIFIKSLVKYEAQYVIAAEEIEAVEWGFDGVTEALWRVEKKCIDIREFYARENLKLRNHTIKLYQINTPNPLGSEGKCVYCGIKLNMEKGDGIYECLGCAQIPEEFKPEIKGLDQIKEEEEKKKSEEEKLKKEPEKLIEKKSDDTKKSENESEEEKKEDEETPEISSPDEDENGIIETFIEPEKKEEAEEKKEDEETPEVSPPDEDEKEEEPKMDSKDQRVGIQFNKMINKMDKKYGNLKKEE